MINHVNMIFFYKQGVTCEKSDVCATVTIDADFDRQIRNNNNNMRAVKRGLVATMGREKYDGSGSQPCEAMTAACIHIGLRFEWAHSPSSSTACLPRFRNNVKPMRGSAPGLAFCAVFGQCRRRNYLCSQQHWLNGFLMTWRPAWPANLCNSRRCWTPTPDGKLRALSLSQMWSPPERQWSCACTD